MKIKLKLLDISLTSCFYSGNTSMYRTIPVGHKYPPPVTVSDKMEWDWNVSDNEDLVFYTDHFIQKPRFGHKKRVAWLLEPYCKQPDRYNWISKHNHLYNYVLTHDRSLLDRGENFIFCPGTGCWIEQENRRIDHEKNKIVSIVTSAKKNVPAHLKRHELINKYKDNIDVMGTGYRRIGAISDGLKDYMFHISMENQQRDFCFSEKLINPFMTGTVPIYYGMPSIGNYFDTRGMILFNNIDEIGDILKNLNENFYKSRLPYIKENFELSKKYILPEDFVFDKIMDLLSKI